jgi:acyl-CoA thioester hydrolase
MQNSTSQPEFVDTIITVRYAETDQMGVVYYGNYFTWFEVGRVAWCRAKGFQYRDMEAVDGHYMVVAEAACRYKAPARFEDDIVIRTAVASATEKVIRFQYEVRNQKTGQLLASGETVHVVTDAQMRPARIPNRYRQYFELQAKRRATEG